jgi:hypothetical protein
MELVFVFLLEGHGKISQQSSIQLTLLLDGLVINQLKTVFVAEVQGVRLGEFLDDGCELVFGVGLIEVGDFVLETVRNVAAHFNLCGGVELNVG